MEKEQKIKKSMEILRKIDGLLNQLEKYDPYGDMVQNFEDLYRERHTLRLLAMLERDLKEKPIGGGWETTNYRTNRLYR